MIQLPENFDSIFRYIEVVSQRAEQIINGARVRTDSKSKKPTLQARDDVDGGAVEWRILTQEELDAQRQAMVEQFRSEMSAETELADGQTIPDVLAPRSGGATRRVAPIEVDRDDELVRLQRLLGMMGGAPDSLDDADDDADDDDDDDVVDVDVVAIVDEEDIAALDLDEGDSDEVDEED